jgi:hypothetical protein
MLNRIILPIAVLLWWFDIIEMAQIHLITEQLQALLSLKTKY